jgi:hypothetical protein
MASAIVRVAALALAGCAGQGSPDAPSTVVAETSPAALVPEAVEGWREDPLPGGVVSIQPGRWRTDAIAAPVKAGRGA